MRLQRWQINLMTALGALTLALYAVRWFGFPDPQLHNEMWRFLVGDVAFLFLQILLVTMVIDGVIQSRQREDMRQKLNMIIGAFFTQTGTELLGRFAETDAALADVRAELIPDARWTSGEFARARAAFDAHEASIQLTPEFLRDLQDALTDRRSYLLGLISNQSLLEHGTFTDLLWAVTHVSEELDARASLRHLGRADIAHLEVDVGRAYRALGTEWLRYLEHLKGSYPHLYSLAVRTNPLDPAARVEISD